MTSAPFLKDPKYAEFNQKFIETFVSSSKKYFDNLNSTFELLVIFKVIHRNRLSIRKELLSTFI